MSASPPFIAPATLAGRLGVHRATVVRWCRTGRLTAWRMPGGRWRIGLAAARELMRAAGATDLP